MPPVEVLKTPIRKKNAVSQKDQVEDFGLTAFFPVEKSYFGESSGSLHK